MWRWRIEVMEDDYDNLEDDAEDDVKVDFGNEIDDEPLVPPAKHSPRLKKLSFSFVALLLVLVGLFNLAMILWFLSR
jgi:hypothetical protein